MAWLYKQKNSENWWIGCRINGRQILKSTGTADRQEAERQLAAIEALNQAHRAGTALDEIYRALSGKGESVVTLRASVAAWLAEIDGTTAPSTLGKYRDTLDEFMKSMNATDSKPRVAEITSEHIRAHLAKLKLRLAPSTVNGYRKILSIFFRSLVASGKLRESPVSVVKALKVKESTSRRTYTIKEIQLIYSKCPDDFWRWMVLAGFYLGQRLGDLICVSVGAFDFGADLIRLRQGKTGVVVAVPMRAKLKELAKNRIAELKTPKPTDYLWPQHAATYIEKGAGGFSNDFKDILAACGLVDARDHQAKDGGLGRGVRRQASELSFHSLRHTFVSMLKITGSGQAIARELAGHSSDAMSDHYTSVPLDALRKAVKKLPEVIK